LATAPLPTLMSLICSLVALGAGLLGVVEADPVLVASGVLVSAALLGSAL
jgi:hypothetical protein